LVDIPATADAAGSFSLLLAALDATMLRTVLEGEGPFTVFAPTDDVINGFLADNSLTVEDLVADTETLAEILKYHVVSGKVTSSDLSDGQLAETLQGDSLTIGVGDDGVTINGSINVVQADVEASNGVIHIIDGLLVPEPASLGTIIDVATDAGSFDTLLGAVEGAQLTEVLQGEGPFTVFAPTDDAFAALGDALNDVVAQPFLLEDVLLYHVLGGEVLADAITDGLSVSTVAGADITFTITDDGVFINDTVEIVSTNIPADNGVIHVIDAVLLPSEELRNAVEYVQDSAAASEEFSILLDAVLAAELAETLSGEGPFTIFAPTNQAFADALESLEITAEELLASEGLGDILTYHVVSGKVMSTDLSDGLTPETLEGSTVTIGVSDSVTVNGATVIIPDVEVSNGVIHVIDGVLLPPE